MAFRIKIFTLLSLLSLVFNSLYAKPVIYNKTITAAVIKDFAPQYLTKNGEPSGFAIDVLNEIAEIAGLKVKYLQFDTWGQTHQSIKDNKAILIPNVGITEKRKKLYDFTSPVETFPVSIFVRNSNATINSFSKLTGMQVGVVKSNVGVRIMEKRTDVKITVYGHLNEALFALMSGEVDAIIYPKTVLEYLAKSIGLFEKIKTTGAYLKEIKRGIAIKKGYPELTARLEQATQQFLKSPRYQVIYSKWHAEPEPFWSTQRVIWLVVLIALIIIAISVLLHYTSLKKINKSLEDTIKQKEITEKQLIKAKEEAEIANVAKSQFLSNMSHEIRTPMNGVFGMVQLLEETVLNKVQKEYTHSITQCGDSLLTIINDILDLSKLEAGKINLEINTFDFKQLIQECVGLFEHSAKQKNILLSIEYDENCPQNFKGDAIRIKQIIMNLLGNALKFTEQGSIKIPIHYLSDQKIQITIVDTGVGIKKEALNTIFDDFSQADASTTRKFGGTGLGLSISKKLVEAMDGSLRVESTFGEGSRFKVKLPLAVSQDMPQPNLQSDVQPVKQLKGHVLLAEDVLPNQIIAKTLLRKLGVTVDVVNNGIEAVNAYKNKHYDLIFMDCKMPELDGYEATKEIRAIEASSQKGSIPIVALTANASAEDKAACLKVGMNDLVAKPYKKRELAECLQVFLN